MINNFVQYGIFDNKIDCVWAPSLTANLRCYPLRTHNIESIQMKYLNEVLKNITDQGEIHDTHSCL